MSNFIKNFIEKINCDVDLFREEGKFNFSNKYDIFVSFYILGIYDAKRFLVNVDNKENINIDLINKINIFKKEFNNQIELLVDESLDESVKSTLKEELLKMYYQGFILYLKAENNAKTDKSLSILSNHFNIAYNDDYNLINSSLKDVITELIFRYVVIDIYGFDSKVR